MHNSNSSISMCSSDSCIIVIVALVGVAVIAV